ncbi:MAG: hypothetical protein EBT97_09075 [Actinobacteria bacterium]|jgi:hypothetical protein|nr:hypothetical protein [Actinomycetota bacterium]NDE81376.1 hypothetical protein [Actinomycetota bacterium]
MGEARMSDVAVTTTVDLSGTIQRRLSDAERKVLRRFQTDALSYITSKWRGWRYAGRPVGAPRNVSLAKWKGKIQSTEANVIGCEISNAAKAWDTGQPYVGAIERRRGAGSEAEKVIGEVIDGIWPQAVEDLTRAVMAELWRPVKPQRLRRTNAAAPTVTAAPIIL